MGRGQIDYPPGVHRIRREAFDWLVQQGIASPEQAMADMTEEAPEVEEPVAEEPVEEAVAEDEGEQTTEPDQVPEADHTHE